MGDVPISYVEGAGGTRVSEDEIVEVGKHDVRVVSSSMYPFLSAMLTSTAACRYCLSKLDDKIKLHLLFYVQYDDNEIYTNIQSDDSTFSLPKQTYHTSETPKKETPRDIPPNQLPFCRVANQPNIPSNG